MGARFMAYTFPAYVAPKRDAKNASSITWNKGAEQERGRLCEVRNSYGGPKRAASQHRTRTHLLAQIDSKENIIDPYQAKANALCRHLILIA